MPEAEGIVYPIEFVFSKVGDAQKAIDGVQSKLANANAKIEGFAEKADKYGLKMMRVGMAFRQFGDLFNSPMLSQLGQFTSGVGGLVDSMGDLVNMVNRLKSMGGIGKALGIGGAVLGGVGLGSSIYDATVGKLQGTDSATIFDQLGKFAGAGFNQDRLRENMAGELSQMRFEIQSAQINANNAVFDFKNSLQNNPKAINDAFKGILGGIGDVLGPAGDYTKRLSAGAGDVSKEQEKKAQSNETAKAIDQYMRRAALVADGYGNIRKVTGEVTQRKGAATRDYQKALFEIEKEVGERRTKIAKSYADDLGKIDAQYYKQRQQLAESYGVETARAEQEHQKNIRRMSEDHNKNIRKLAESRDALAIEDEIDAYNTERQRADEDYQDAARQRSEDYARQLQELETSHREQQDERRKAYQEQLADLQQYQKDRRQAEMNEYSALIAELIRQYTEAVAQIKGTMQTVNNTNNANTTINQNFNGANGQMSPEQVRQETYNAMNDVMRRALQ